VELLAGQKESCQDDLEFIKVPRPATCPSPAVEAPEQAPVAGAPALVDSARHLAVLDSSSVALGHPAEVAMKWVQVSGWPLGSAALRRAAGGPCRPGTSPGGLGCCRGRRA
jgi:molybdenum cofactor sulfurtransferase